MPLPAGIDTCTVTMNVPLDALGNLAVSVIGNVRPDRYLVWQATGEPILEIGAKIPTPSGGVITMTLPTTNQSGIVDSEGNAVTNWSYRIWYKATFANRQKADYTKPFQIDQALTSLDLDSVPFGNVVIPAVTAPSAVVSSVAGLTGVVSASALAGELDSHLVGKYTRVDIAADHNADRTGATSAVAAFTAAINAAIAAGGARIIALPPGTYDLTAGGLPDITVPDVYFEGVSRNHVTIKVNTGTLFKWSSSRGGVSGVNFLSASAPASDQRLFDVVSGSTHRFINLGIDNVRQIARLGHGGGYASNVLFRDVTGATDPAAGSVVFDCVAGASLVMDNIVLNAKNVGFPANATDPHPANDTTCLRFGQGAWDTALLSKLQFNRYNRDIDFNVVGAWGVGNMYISDCVFDYAKTNGVRLLAAASGAGIRTVVFRGCWFVATDGHSVSVDSTAVGSVIKHIHFTDCVGRQAGQNNWRFAGTNSESIRVLNCHSLGANRLAATNTGSLQDDLVILGEGVTVQGGRFGEDGAPYVGFTNQARYGVNVSPDLTSVAVLDVASEGATGAFVLNPNTTGSRRRLVRGNRRHNSTSAPEYASTAAITAPTSGVAQTQVAPTLDTLYIFGGTVTNITHNGAQIGTAGPATITLRPGDTWQVTYTLAPTIIRSVGA